MGPTDEEPRLQIVESEENRRPESGPAATPDNLECVHQISLEIAEAENSDHVGMLVVKPANRVIADAAAMADPRPLFDHLWYEGEACCLFADTNIGKSILATQIAELVARENIVTLCDFEQSDKVFQQRNTVDGVPHVFPSTFFRAQIDPNRFSSVDYEDRIMGDIEAAVRKTGSTCLIIDNLGYLCNSSEKGTEAGSFMIRLIQLKFRLSLSILIVAHTPKRKSTEPLTINDLAGSRKLANYFDSVFTIGRASESSEAYFFSQFVGGSVRYLKQLKTRQGEIKYGANNVIVYRITQDDGYTHFERVECRNERDLLLAEEEVEKIEQRRLVMDLVEKGASYRSIADKTGIPKSTVGNIVKAAKKRLGAPSDIDPIPFAEDDLPDDIVEETEEEAEEEDDG